MTNKCPTGAVRGFGGPQLYFAVERMMHTIAIELRARSARAYPPQSDSRRVVSLSGAGGGSDRFRATTSASSTDTVQQGGLEELQDGRDTRARAEGKLYGIGYAVVVEPSQSNMGYISTLKTGIERERAGQKDGAVAAATINIDPLGAVSVVADSVPQGQGHQTALAQIVADQLGVRVEDVVVNLEIDTQKDGWSIAAGNYSCRFAPATVSATHLAAVRLRDKLARIAAPSLNVPPDKIEFAGGKVFARDNPDNALSLHRVAGQAHWSPASLPDGMAPALARERHLERAGADADDRAATRSTRRSPTASASISAASRSIATPAKSASTNTSPVTIAEPFSTRAWPTGRSTAPSPRPSAPSLYEEFVYAEDGSFLSGTFADYLVATAAEMPKLDVLHPVQSPSPFTRLRRQGNRRGQPVQHAGLPRQRGRRCARAQRHHACR